MYNELEAHPKPCHTILKRLKSPRKIKRIDVARAGVEPTGGRLCGELAPPRTRMRTWKYKTTVRSARCNHCPFSKWVRAKVSISAHNKKTAHVGGFVMRLQLL